MTSDVLLGPLAGLAILLVICTLFYTGKILPRNTVPREDLDKVIEINASYAVAMKESTAVITELVTVVRAHRPNGGT